MGPPLQHVCGIAIGYCEARAVIIRRDAPTNAIGQPSLVASESGARSTPCAVALGGTGECVVGDAALSQASKNPAAVATVSLAAAGVSATECVMTDLWEGTVVAGGAAGGTVRYTFPPPTKDGPYQSGLFSLTGCK